MVTLTARARVVGRPIVHRAYFMGPGALRKAREYSAAILDWTLVQGPADHAVNPVLKYRQGR